MSWAVGYDDNWKRDIGYGVPAVCDHPECNEEIHRGLGYVCGGEPYGGETGCGLYFCGRHLLAAGQLCLRCAAGSEPFTPKPDRADWLSWKLEHPSWRGWREDNPEAVVAIRRSLSALGPAEGE